MTNLEDLDYTEEVVPKKKSFLRSRKLKIAIAVLAVFIVYLVLAAPAYSGNDVNFYYINGSQPTRVNIWTTSTDTIGTSEWTNDSATTNKIIIQACDIPNRNQTIIGSTRTTPLPLTVQVHNGSGTIGNNITAMTRVGFNGAGGFVGKVISCAVEELSGKGVFIATEQGTDNITIWNGTNWELKKASLDQDTIFVPKQSWLKSRKGSNEIVYWGESTNNYTWVGIWNASSNDIYEFFNLTGVGEGSMGEAGGNVRKNQTSACTFESISGNLVCFYGNYSVTNGTIFIMERNATEASVNPQQKFWTQGDLNPANLSGRIVYVSVEANPVTDEILILVATDGNTIDLNPSGHASDINLSVMVWDGSKIGNRLQLETNFTEDTGGGIGGQEINYDAANAVYRYFNTNSTETEAVFCWSNTVDTAANCRKWNGTTYSDEINTPAISAGTADVRRIMMATSINDATGLGTYWASMATTDSDADFNIVFFNGSVWGNLNELTPSLLNGARVNGANVWVRYDTTVPVFRSTGTNDTDNQIPQNALLCQTTETCQNITLNASVRDQFQLDCMWIETNETGIYTNYTDGSRINCNLRNDAVWQTATFNWVNLTDIDNSQRAIGYNFCANDTNGNKACSDRREFLMQNAAAPDECVPTANQDWVITSCNCVITGKDYFVNKLNWTGSGLVEIVSSNISYTELNPGDSCSIGFRDSTNQPYIFGKR